jgi:hypothetical protein
VVVGPWNPDVPPSGPMGPQGRLHLTNLRLVFEAMVYEGMLGQAPRTFSGLNLMPVAIVRSAVGPRGQQAFRTASIQNQASTFGTPNAANWTRVIWKGRAAPLASTPPPPVSASGQVVVQVHQSAAEPTVFLHRRHCGRLTPAGTYRCTSGGAAL